MDPSQRGFQGGPPAGFTPGSGQFPGGRPGRGLFLGLPPWMMFVVFGVTMLVLAIAFYQLYKKAGYNGLLGLLMLIPGVNLAMMLFLAFADWPVLKQAREHERQRAEAAAMAPVASEPPVS